MVWLPDSETNWLYTLMLAEPSLSLIAVAREGLAFSTEPFLKAFGIHYHLVENDADAPRISQAFDEVRKNQRPVAILVGDEYHGFH